MLQKILAEDTCQNNDNLTVWFWLTHNIGDGTVHFDGFDQTDTFSVSQLFKDISLLHYIIFKHGSGYFFIQNCNITIQTLHQSDQQPRDLSHFPIFNLTLDVLLNKYGIICGTLSFSLNTCLWIYKKRATPFAFHLKSAPVRSLNDLCTVTKLVTWHT